MKTNKIRMQYLMNRNSKGNPEPRKERLIMLQLKGSGSLVTLNPQQSQILTGVL